MDALSKLFMYIPGIVIFLVGSGQVRGWLRRKLGGGALDGKVIGCEHVIKRDRQDREVYNYYNVTVEYRDPATQHTIRQSLKSPTEYALSQPVHVFPGKNGEKMQLSEKEDEAMFHPWALMIGGALLIILALEENQGKEVPAMVCLAIVLAGAGLSMIWNFVKLKKRHLQRLDAEIVEIYTRQISRATKILKGDKFTYYPVVKYMLDGKENMRRCLINSSGSNTFKVGEQMPLYRDPANGVILEKNARPVILFFGIVLLAAGILAGASILSVVL